MEVGFIQFAPKFGNSEYNTQKVLHLLGIDRADIIVLPELFTTGYLFKDRKELERLSENVNYSVTISKFKELSKEKNAIFIGGFPEKSGDNIYNSQFLVDGDKIFIYRKNHLFYEEKKIFEKGNSNLPIYDNGIVKIGLMICFDWIFPEMMRSLALAGADIICHSANLVMPFCQDAMITRAIENRIYIITANRTGKDERGGKSYLFTGRSQIVAPGGDIILSTGKDNETFLKIDIDPKKSRDKNINNSNNLFEDRRTDRYKL